MAFVYFEKEETDRKLTLPNALTAARGIGGLVMGTVMSRNGIDPSVAAAAVVAAGVSDAEGNIIKFFNQRPRLSKIQDKLRILPSEIGRKCDPIADKLFVVGCLIGGIIGHYLPLVDAVPILSSEIAIAAVGIKEEATGHEVRVNKWGKGGLLARGAALFTDLIAGGLHGSTHEPVQMLAHGLTVSAIAMAGLNVATILRENHQQQHLPPTETA